MVKFFMNSYSRNHI